MVYITCLFVCLFVWSRLIKLRLCIDDDDDDNKDNNNNHNHNNNSRKIWAARKKGTPSPSVLRSPDSTQIAIIKISYYTK
jgi:hypothetical protein